MSKDNSTIAVDIDTELRGQIGLLMMEKIDSPEKMNQLPSVVCTLIASAVGMLMVTDMSEEACVELVEAVTKATFENEKDRVEAVKEVSRIMSSMEDEA